MDNYYLIIIGIIIVIILIIIYEIAIHVQTHTVSTITQPTTIDNSTSSIPRIIHRTWYSKILN